MSALVAAAKAEGTLSLTADPPTWANYGSIIKDFGAKYGLHINDFNPGGSSAEELSEITLDKGKSNEPDVVDVGTSFAIEAVTGEPGVFKGRSFPSTRPRSGTSSRRPGRTPRVIGLTTTAAFLPSATTPARSKRRRPRSPACCSPSSRARSG